MLSGNIFCVLIEVTPLYNNSDKTGMIFDVTNHSHNTKILTDCGTSIISSRTLVLSVEVVVVGASVAGEWLEMTSLS